ncbi:MAG TPA: GlsB/YeaQ/YmgE family stress response membrane protein [Armatimonadota bacterium]|jgi:uncharacterized membrane protein YeaQ/YmgE (transglycosylase-associated protein family)
MGWVAAIVGGFLAGIIAKALVRGEEPGGFLMDVIIGIVGGVLGRLVLGMVGLAYYGNAFYNLVVAVIGAVILLVLYHAISGSGRRAGTPV